MKRLLALCLLPALLLTGCSNKTADNPEPVTSPTHEEAFTGQEIEDGVIQISERLFIAQTNDIYLNADDYLGSVIRYEGIFKTINADDNRYRYVIRYGPGCCGYDGEAGFEVDWAGDWPEEDDWCEVVGVLGEYENANGWKYLYLELSSLTVLEERGAEFVST